MKAGPASAWILLLFATCVTAAALEYNPAPAADASQLRTYHWRAGPGVGTAAIDRAITAQVDAQLAAKGWERDAGRAGFELSAHYRQDACGGVGHCQGGGVLAVDLIDPHSHRRVWHGELAAPGAARPEPLDHRLGQLFAAFPMQSAPR
ncbi:MAG TPA: DUF4136 domain-containing protein [Stenotrophomonas sp.]|nr:DUF4136 domain-containing protein [Stenotrophomonas sp.]